MSDKLIQKRFNISEISNFLFVILQNAPFSIKNFRKKQKIEFYSKKGLGGRERCLKIFFYEIVESFFIKFFYDLRNKILRMGSNSKPAS